MNLTEQQKMQQRQALPLEQKIAMTKQRIKDWYDHWDGEICLSFSGGKDSQVLAQILRSMGRKYKEIPLVFSNTGLEMPEIVDHVRKLKASGWPIVEIKPKRNFRDVWQEDGLPLVSKKSAKMIRVLQEGPNGKNENMHRLYDIGVTSKGHQAPRWKLAKKWRHLVDSNIKISEKCCDALKKEPIKTYKKATSRKSMTGMMAAEGGSRGGMTICNAYEASEPMSSPMLFWKDSDVWQYIEENNIEICSVYYNRQYDEDGELIASDHPQSELPSTGAEKGRVIEGEKRTGCMFCAFGAHLEKGSNRFQRMSVSHPRQHALIMDRIGMREPLELINVKVTFDD
jgi:3'-phosphoadenosine 5'-phosphosulfate sulfotransferase (PAPS reductase)/FAD synthetase